MLPQTEKGSAENAMRFLLILLFFSAGLREQISVGDLLPVIQDQSRNGKKPVSGCGVEGDVALIDGKVGIRCGIAAAEDVIDAEGI